MVEKAGQLFAAALFREAAPVALKGAYRFHSRKNEDLMLVLLSMLF